MRYINDDKPLTLPDDPEEQIKFLKSIVLNPCLLDKCDKEVLLLLRDAAAKAILRTRSNND